VEDQNGISATACQELAAIVRAPFAWGRGGFALELRPRFGGSTAGGFRDNRPRPPACCIRSLPKGQDGGPGANRGPREPKRRARELEGGSGYDFILSPIADGLARLTIEHVRAVFCLFARGLTARLLRWWPLGLFMHVQAVSASERWARCANRQGPRGWQDCD